MFRRRADASRGRLQAHQHRVRSLCATEGSRLKQSHDGQYTTHWRALWQDVVTFVGDRRVTTPRQLVEAIRSYRPDEPVPFTLKRGSRVLKIEATLGEEEEPPTGNRNTENFSRRRSGFPSAFQHDTPLQPEYCGGVVVDISGKAVGLNIARLGRTGSLALPPDVVRSFVNRTLRTQRPL